MWNAGILTARLNAHPEMQVLALIVTTPSILKAVDSVKGQNHNTLNILIDFIWGNIS